MIKVAILDDNQQMHGVIERILLNAPELKAIKWSYDSFYSGESFLESDNINTYHILLLDIDLPGMSGVTLASKLRQVNDKISIIFITSYDGFMKDAFGLNVHDYVLKQNMYTSLPKTIYTLMKSIHIDNTVSITFNTDMGRVSLPEKDIVCIIYEDRKPIIYFKQGTLSILGEAMYEIHEKLSQNLFIRPNSGSIVNIKYIKEMKKPVIKMWHYHEIIHISRNKYRETRDKYRAYFMQGESL